MTSVNGLLSQEDKVTGNEGFLDLESGTQNGRPQSRLACDMKSPSLLKPPKDLSIVHKILSYPFPGSLKLSPTSYLNGVRGIAALLVYIFHAFGVWFPLVPAYHATPTQTNILQLPLIRTIFVSGGAAVSVFFALSGYVLTHKSLYYIRTSSRAKVPASVYSSMFRRGFRLYLPPILLTFYEMLATRFGFPPPLNFTFKAEETFREQLVDWVWETNRFINPIHNFGSAIKGFVVHPKYDPVIWTIPLEFYGSFVVYSLVLLLMRVPKNRVRMGLVGIFSVLCMLLGSWNMSCFAAGMLIADFNLGQEEESSTTASLKSARYEKLWIAVLAVAFYVAGLPTLGNGDAKVNPMPGFETLRALTPTSLTMDDHARFWWSISGVSILFSISQVSRLKGLFETYFCQYLAKISFALYLVHEFCIVLFGLALQKSILQIVGLDPNLKVTTVLYCVVCVIWFLIFTVPVFALAAQVEKWVDVPSVKFAKWLEEKCLTGYRRI